MITTTVQQLAITIPDGATPGSLLSIPVKGIDNVHFRVPEGYTPGSTLTLCKENGEWIQTQEVEQAEQSTSASAPCPIADQVADDELALVSPDAGPEPKVESFTVRMNTLAGGLDIIVRPDWSPHGARRFLEMAALGDLDNLSFYRAIPGCIAQFGLPARRAWPPIPDDPLVGVPFLLGAVCFTAEEPNSRRSTLFICTGDMRQSMGNQPWETPIGAVAENSLETLDHIETMYGEVAEHGGYGPEVQRIEREGDTYLRMHFPLLTYIKAARPLDWQMSSKNGASQERAHPQEPVVARSATQIHTHVHFATETHASTTPAVHQEDLQPRSPQRIAVEVIASSTHQSVEHDRSELSLPPQEVPVHVVMSPRQNRQLDVPVEVPVEISTLSATSRKSMASESPVEVPVEVRSMSSRSGALEVGSRSNALEVPVEVAQPRSGVSYVPQQHACSSYCVQPAQNTNAGSYQYSHPSAAPQHGLPIVSSSSCPPAGPMHSMPNPPMQGAPTLGPQAFDHGMADYSMYQAGNYTLPPAQGSYQFTAGLQGQSSSAGGSFNALPYLGMCNANPPQLMHQQPQHIQSPQPAQHMQSPQHPLGLAMPGLQNPTLRMPQLAAPMLGPVPALKAPSLEGFPGMQAPGMPWAM